jgi:hypothetical protein
MTLPMIGFLSLCNGRPECLCSLVNPLRHVSKAASGWVLANHGAPAFAVEYLLAASRFYPLGLTTASSPPFWMLGHLLDTAVAGTWFTHINVNRVHSAYAQSQAQPDATVTRQSVGVYQR